MKGLKPPRIYWCVSRGYPTTDPRFCLELGDEAIEVYGVRGDPYPMFEGDWRVFREALKWSLDVSEDVVDKLATGISVKVKIDALEVGYNIVFNSGVAGVLEFDLGAYRWVLSPRGWLASLIYKERVGNVGHVTIRVARGDVIPWSVVKGVDVKEEGKRIVARDVTGRIAVLKVEKSGLRVEWVEAFREDVDWPKASSSLDQFLDYYWRFRVSRMYEEAKEWLTKTLSSYGVSAARISGGKDSTLVAQLYVEAGGKHLVFTDTGFEFPETIEVIDKISSSIGNVEVVKPPRDCWKLMEAYGPPGRDYRWCTQVCKLGPAGGYIRRLGAKIVVTGARGLESPSRAREGKLSRSRGAGGGDYIASPLYEWTALDVYAAVKALKLPLNKLYMHGYERVGCYICPSSSIPEFQTTARIHPELWGRWLEFLQRYASSRDLPDVWLKYHLWRWRFNPPPRLRNYARNVLGVRWERLIEKTAVTVIAEVSREFPSLRLSNPLGKHISVNDIRLVAYAIGPIWSVTSSHVTVKPSKTAMVVFYEGGDIYIESVDWNEIKALAEDAVRVLAMASACTGCMVCVEKCPHNAIRVVNSKPMVDPKRCIACRKCLYSCPVAGYALLSHTVGLQESIDNALEKA